MSKISNNFILEINRAKNILIEYFADGSFFGDHKQSKNFICLWSPTKLPSAKYLINIFLAPFHLFLVWGYWLFWQLLLTMNLAQSFCHLRKWTLFKMPTVRQRIWQSYSRRHTCCQLFTLKYKFAKSWELNILPPEHHQTELPRHFPSGEVPPADYAFDDTKVNKTEAASCQRQETWERF